MSEYGSVRLGGEVGYRAPLGLQEDPDRSPPSPLGWAEGARTFGPEASDGSGMGGSGAGITFRREVA